MCNDDLAFARRIESWPEGGVILKLPLTCTLSSIGGEKRGWGVGGNEK